MNKQLWTPSYVCFTAGMSGISLSIFYCILDYKSSSSNDSLRQRMGKAFPLLLQPMRWVGLNTIFIFLCADSSIPYNLQAWIYWGEQQWNLIDSMYYLLCSQPSVDHDLPWTYRLNTLVCKHGMFEGAKEKWAMLVYTLVRIAWWSLVAGYLHRKKWYWAL